MPLVWENLYHSQWVIETNIQGWELGEHATRVGKGTSRARNLNIGDGKKGVKNVRNGEICHRCGKIFTTAGRSLEHATNGGNDTSKARTST